MLLRFFFFIIFFHLHSTNSSTMAPTSKAKKPTVASDGKLSFNTSSSDFNRLVNLMSEPGFFQQYKGLMAFFDHPNNIFWSRTYSRSTFLNGYNTAKKKAQEIQAGIAAAPADEDEPTAGNINDLFAINGGAAIGLKKRAVSPVVDEPPVEGPVDLGTDIVIPLANDEEHFVPNHRAVVVKGESQSHCLALNITSSAGVVPYPDQNEELDLSGFATSIVDGPNGECVCAYKECQSITTYNAKWKKATFQQQRGYGNTKDWNRVFLAMENDVASHQQKDGDPLYGVAQFTLPFKCLKNIKEEDYFPIFHPDTGAFSFTVLLWHADQSGRTAAPLKKAFNAIAPVKKSK